jgi:serine/threonine protein kinase
MSTPLAPRSLAEARGHVLPVGTRVGGLEITGLIGEGGFGIVYLAHDASLERQVAVKEYMPGSLAARAADSLDVTIRSERHKETFDAGLKSFVNEARLLARFDHPALVKVFRFWEANRTAYMAMPYYQGPTLKAALRDLGAPPQEAQLRAWLQPLLAALSVMHKENCFHRDIAPDNILLTDRGPLLLDFGAARRVIGDMTQALTVVLKPGYAPIEQYGESATMTQGAWTDLYALASVVHYAITGRAPVASVERMMGTEIESLALSAAGRYSAGFLRAIDAALALRPTDRPQDVAQFCELLDAGLPAHSPERFRPSGFQASGFQTSGFTPAAFDGAPHAVGDAAMPSPSHTTLPPSTLQFDEKAAAPPPIAGRSRRGVLIGATLGILAVAGFGGALLTTRGRPTRAMPTAPPRHVPAPAAPLAAVPAPTAATPPAMSATPAPAASAPAAAQVQAPPPPAPAPAPVAEAPPERATTPAAAPAAKPAPEPRAAAAPAVPGPGRAAARPERCSDILQKASLEPLSAEETAYLRSACR